MKNLRFCYLQGYKPLVVYLLVLLISSSLLCSTVGQDSAVCVDSAKNGLRVTTCQHFNRIPESISSDIQSLILDNNRIFRLENEEFQSLGLVHLQRISLHSSTIRNIERGAFEGLRILNYLDLSNNDLENVDPHIFAPLVGLKELKLNGNPLQRFINSQTKMPALLNLKILDLSDCQLASLHVGLFDNVGYLEKLNLNGNKIQKLAVNVITPLSRLNFLDLARNPWKCDCHVRDLRKWVVDRNLASNTVCDDSGKAWKDMSDSEFFCPPVLNFLRVHVGTQTFVSTDVIQQPGSNIIFECEVEADPSADILWMKDDQVLFNSTITDFKSEKHVVYTVGSSPKWSNLTVKDVTLEDHGLYTCQGVNMDGQIAKTVTLNVDEVVTGAILPGKSKTWLWILLGVLGFLMLLLALVIVVLCYFKYRQGRRKTQRVADGKIQKAFEKKPVADETDNAVSSPLLQKPDVVLAKEIPLGTGPNGSEFGQPGVIENTAMKPVLPLLYGHQPRLAATPTHLSHSQIFIPQQFDQPYGGWASYDPRRAPQNSVSLHYRPPGPYGRLHSPFSGSVASFTSEPAPRVPPGLGYVTLPRRRRIPSWSPASGYPRNQAPVPLSPTGSLPIPTFRMRYQPLGPRYDNIGPRTTADGGSNLSLNTVGLGQNPQPSGRTPTGYLTPMTPSTPASGRIPRTTFTPNTPLSGRVPKSGPSHQNYMTLPSSHFNFDPIQENEGPTTPLAAPADHFWSPRDAVNNSNVPTHTYPLQSPSFSPDYGQKVPPVPPAKPKRKSANLDEQDIPNLANIPGTEV